MGIKNIAAVGILAFIFACASTPEISNLEKPILHRSEVLPKGVASYYLISGVGFNKDSNSDSGAYVFPIYWENGISERLTLIWMPVPLGFRYLLQSDPQSWTWIDVDSVGYVYAQQRVFLWNPSAAITHKWLYSDEWGGHLGFFSSAEVDRDPFGLSPTLGIKAGLDTQLIGWLFLSGSFLPMLERGETTARYLGSAPASSRGRDSGTRIRFPVELKVAVQSRVQWKAELKLYIYKLGYESGYLGLPLFASMAYSW